MSQSQLPPQPAAPPPPPKKPFPWGTVLKIGAGVGTVIVAYKAIQALSDKEYSGRTLPRAVRDGLKLGHYCDHGEFCPSCGLPTEFDDLHVDHVVPYSKGGRTSLRNSRVICKPCNLEKGDRVGILDHLRGRGGRRS